MDTNTLTLSGGNFGGYVVDVASNVAYLPVEGDEISPTIQIESVDGEVIVEGWVYRPTGDGLATFVGMK